MGAALQKDELAPYTNDNDADDWFFVDDLVGSLVEECGLLRWLVYAIC